MNLCILYCIVFTFSDRDDIEVSNGNESLLSLVTPELTALISGWLFALRDSALLSLPAEFGNQLPPEGGAYYTPETVDSCRQHYRHVWPPILLATATWLRHNQFETPKIEQVHIGVNLI